MLVLQKIISRKCKCILTISFLFSLDPDTSFKLPYLLYPWVHCVKLDKMGRENLRSLHQLNGDDRQRTNLYLSLNFDSKYLVGYMYLKFKKKHRFTCIYFFLTNFLHLKILQSKLHACILFPLFLYKTFFTLGVFSLFEQTVL